VFDDIRDSDVLVWSHDLTTFATGFHETLDNQQGHKFGVSLLRSAKKSFITTDQQVLEIRLSPSGSAVFARTQAGWSAWDTSDGKSLPSGPLPPSDEDFEIWNDRVVTSPDGKFRIIDQRQLVDTATGRILVTALNLRLSDGWKYVWASSDSRSITVWDVASGQKLWTVTANDTNDESFLVVELPDGHLRLSESAERLVSLVRGYQVRPFDDLAKRAFLPP
jgi:WD40 repeat protein